MYSKEIRAILDEFRMLCAIPHGSGMEREIGEHLKNRLTSLGAEVHQDETGNILGIVNGRNEKSGLTGTEGKIPPALILQAHMDMVIAGDLLPEEAVVNTVFDGDILRSDGHTTLGADNGIGIATILSVIRLAERIPIEIRVLFTVSEEVGLKGARAVSPKWMEGARYMINTDGFHSDTEVVGCKGGLRETFSRALLTERILDKADIHSNYTKKKNQLHDTELYEVKLEGFLGGHSGDDIDKHRCNSIHQLAEILRDIQDHFDIRIAHIKGGTAYNAIPSECSAVVAVPRACRISAGKILLKDEVDLQRTFEKTDPTGRLTVRWLGETAVGNTLWDYDFQREVLHFITHMHDGINALNEEGEVSSSSNLGEIMSRDGVLYIGDMLRCDTRDQEAEIIESHHKIAEESGFSVNVTGYHSWHSSPNSDLANMVGNIYEKIQGVPMRRRIAKVGLEPAFFHELSPEMDIVCLGAEISNAHSVKERVVISSIGLLYRLISETINEIEKGNN